MKAFSLPAAVPDADHPSVMLPSPAVGNSPSDTKVSVGQSRHNHIRQAEDELDEVIADIAMKSALAEDRGDIETAKDLSRRMVEAIASRTPEHKARRDAVVYGRILGGQ